MILADILQWFLLVLGAFLTLNAYWLGARALCPSTVGRARNQYERRPVRASLIGALITVPVVLISILLASKVPHPAVQMGAVGLLLVLSLVGLAVGGTGGYLTFFGYRMSKKVHPVDDYQRAVEVARVHNAQYVR